MNDNIKKLKIEFYKIQCKNWIKNVEKGTSAAGKMLENLLGKEDDNLIIADYCGIELKTKFLHSEPYIGLFSMVPDNRPLVLKEILSRYGWPSKKDRNYKVFFGVIYGNKFTKIGLFNEFKLEVDKINKKIWFVVKNKYTNYVSKNISWSFEQLENRLMMKLNCLALIPVEKRKYKNDVYFKYHNFKLYKLRSFDCFLDLIFSGFIRINMKISFYTSQDKYGKIHDKGTTFEIDEKNINKLFAKIDINDI